jgi:beta-glucosidase
LRGFDKLKLDPGNQSEVSFALTRRDLSHWDAGKRDWVVPSGAFTFSAGFSSSDLKVTKTVNVIGAC